MCPHLYAGVLSFPLLCLGWWGSVSAAIWVEVDDAGQLPETAQVTIGTGPLTSISGVLSHDEDVDVFKIFISGDGTFSAATQGLALIDPQLFLFDAAGLGVYMNDDANLLTFESALPAGDPLTPLLPGIYYLAIAPYGMDPISVAGRIFPDPSFFFQDVVGPTGPGGSFPVSAFVGDGAGDFGQYLISLTGAFPAAAALSTAAAPEPGTVVVWLLAAGLVTAGRMKRRRRGAGVWNT